MTYLQGYYEHCGSKLYGNSTFSPGKYSYCEMPSAVLFKTKSQKSKRYIMKRMRRGRRRKEGEKTERERRRSIRGGRIWRSRGKT